jgi:hypothetical protein
MRFSQKRIWWPLAAGLAGSLGLSVIYLGIVSIAESPQHALDLFWQDRWIVLPILLGFGVQTALYTIIKKRLFFPVEYTGPSGKLVGAGGATSTLAMVACCAHHVTDALPILGLTAAASFLAQYRTAFLVIGLGTTLLGIIGMSILLFKERRKAIRHLAACTMETL